MKKPAKNKINNHQPLKTEKNTSVVPLLRIDQEIVIILSKVLKCKTEKQKGIYRTQLDELILSREKIIKTSRDLIRLALKGTSVLIKDNLPDLMYWPEECLYFQHFTKSRYFCEEAIGEYARYFRNLSCPDKNGMVQVFHIRIKAFTRLSEDGKIEYQGIRVIFSPRSTLDPGLRVPIKYSVN
jgi:hypothetical protein